MSVVERASYNCLRVKIVFIGMYPFNFGFCFEEEEEEEVVYAWCAGRSRDRIPLGARFSAPVQTDPGAHPVSCTMGTGSFPRVESGRGVTLTLPTPF
jgi:hypothetical protein